MPYLFVIIALQVYPANLNIPRDRSIRFIFEDLGVRGQLVYLDQALSDIFENKQYPAEIARQLGEAMTASAILANTIKLDGSLILQIQGEGPLSTLVAQANNLGHLRGLAIYKDILPDSFSLGGLLGKARLVITIDAEGSQRYQGIVEAVGETLPDMLDSYFKQSEQLSTRFWLASDGERAAGLMLQNLPSENCDLDMWKHVVALSETVSKEELLTLSDRELIYRLFHQESIRIFEPHPLLFSCGCNTKTVETVLLQLGEAEINKILQEEGEVTADCEFCNKQYRYDLVDAAALFKIHHSLPELQQ